MIGVVRAATLHGASAGGTAVTMFTPEQIPVKHAVAKEFGVFNKLYTAVPSASSPNHLFTQSATSCGMQTNTLYDKCGGKKVCLGTCSCITVEPPPDPVIEKAPEPAPVVEKAPEPEEASCGFF